VCLLLCISVCLALSVPVCIFGLRALDALHEHVGAQLKNDVGKPLEVGFQAAIEPDGRLLYAHIVRRSPVRERKREGPRHVW
jgi:hypothetical protein